ncbi:hypothetical protein TrRE_jg3320, partial [Triparma retinervis]
IINTNTQAKYSLISADDQNYLYECAGLLKNNCGLGVCACSISLFTSPLLFRMRSLISSGSSGGSGWDRGEAGAEAGALMTSMASLSKGFVRGGVDGESGDAFRMALQAAVQVLGIMGEEEQARGGGMVLAHRMVALLGDEVTAWAGGVVGPLVRNCERDVVEVVQLMNQLLIRFGGRMASCMEKAVLPFMVRCEKLAPVDGSREQVEAEARGLHKIQILFLQHLVSNGCGGVLFSKDVAPGLEGILDLVARGMEIKEGARSCVIFMRKLCEEVGGGGAGEGVEGAFWDFVFNRSLVHLWRAMMGKGFSAKDAQCLRTLAEGARLMVVVRERRTERFMGFVDALSGFVGDIKGREVNRMKGANEGEFKDIIKRALMQ